MPRWSALIWKGACLFTISIIVGSAAADDPTQAQNGIDSEVAVQFAMLRGNDLLRQGNPAKAVEVLEAELPRINGNRKFLMLLRRAYVDYITNLFIADQKKQAEIYLSRLEILDPDAAKTLRGRPDTQLTRTGSSTPSSANLPISTPGKQPETRANNTIDPNALPPETPSSVRPTVRAKTLDNTDPFARENKLPTESLERPRTSTAPELFAQAELHFQKHRYDEALLLYEQVARVDPKVLAGAEDRWAYCKLHKVVEQLNRPDANAIQWQALESDVKSALAMAPSLNKTGTWLLNEIANRRNPIRKTWDSAETAVSTSVHVTHHAEPNNGWHVAETEHFRIFHKRDRTFAEQIARTAEDARVAMTAKWFGDAAQPWRTKCDIFLHETAADYSQATGVPQHSPGHSRIETDGTTGAVVSRRIDLRCDNPELLTAVLPHETTHVVLAGQFGRYAVPRWVDEGIAVLTEPEEKIAQHVRNLQRFASSGQLFAVHELMELHDYPPARRIGAFYAQSVSLVQFMSRLRGPQVFARFVQDGLRDGYRVALQRHYQLQNFNELETQWANEALPMANAGPSGTSQR